MSFRYTGIRKAPETGAQNEEAYGEESKSTQQARRGRVRPDAAAPESSLRHPRTISRVSWVAASGALRRRRSGSVPLMRCCPNLKLRLLDQGAPRRPVPGLWIGDEIGRASCRERGCLYLEDSVGPA